MSNAAVQPLKAQGVDIKLEAAVILISDTDRAKRFYRGLGAKFDVDYPNEGIQSPTLAMWLHADFRSTTSMDLPTGWWIASSIHLWSR